MPAFVMRRVQAADHFLERWMVLLTPAAMAAGWRWQQVLSPYASASTWLFALMTLALSLGTSWSDLRRVTARPLPAAVALLLLHLVAPLYAWLAWQALFPASPDMGIGLLLATAVPTGVSALLWVSLAGGDVPLALTLVALDTLLSPLVVPLIIHLFAGRQVPVAVGAFVLGLVKMAVLPTLLGVTSHDLTGGRLHRTLEPYAQLAAKVTMILAVLLSVANSAARLPTLDRHYLPAILILLALSALGYLSGFAAARLLRWAKPVAVSLAYCTGFRNTVAGTVIAAAYFPPRVALTVCLMMLFQQPLAALVHRLFTGGARRVSSAA
ncbi:MAG: bile acid:sodium symporter [Bacillota bacterium]|nr:bile acid:sodium symporter [Bacillota bacterium]